MSKIRLLATSDVHGYIPPYSYGTNESISSGMSRISTMIQSLRDENTLVLDNGDTIQGSPLLYYHHLYEVETVNPMAKVLNVIGYDYVNTGNHEFNYGFENLKKYYSEIDAKWICGNINYQEKALNEPYVIHTFPNGKKIALIAAVTDYIPHWEQPRHIVDITFTDVVSFVKKAVEMARPLVDAVVVMYHGGFEKDMTTGEITEKQTGENVGYRLCHEIEGIDVLISGHQHRSIYGVCGSTAYTQTAFNAKELACIDIEFNEEGLVITPSVLPVQAESDQAVMDVISEIEGRCQTWLDQPLGQLDEGDLLITDLFDARVHKHKMVSFLNQVQLYFSNADLSGVALANEVKGFCHEITMRDIVSTYVFPNTLCVVGMKGNDVKAMLELCAEYFDVKDGQFCVSHRFLEPKPAHYNYDMFDGEGVSYTIHVNREISNRVTDIKIKGEPIDFEKEYSVVVNNYRAAGGGNFDMFERSRMIHDLQRDVVECIAQYILDKKTIHVEHEDNITVVMD